ncbi:uncharacterized protein [Miscanthus floridulus]|uniref:uncharacterized protein n=1 Tax=Miscanthus floridulus TaxID=154761 RepID=UPI003459872D
MVKEAWDAVKNLWISDASALQLHQEFGNLSFKEGESINEFGICITALATNLCSLGDNIIDTEVVKKLLLVAPERLNQAAVSLEMFLDLNKVTIEEVVGWLHMFEERTKPKQVTDAMGRLMLCEEDREAHRKDCHGKKMGTAHVAQAKEEGALMYITTNVEARVHLVERKVLLHLSEEEKEAMRPHRWVLDTGAMNRMTGSRSVFVNLNTGVAGTVKFGDGSVVAIEGKGTVLFAYKNGEHHRLDGVYYMPHLTTNIVSLGQMDEDGFKVDIESRILLLYDLQQQLLTKVHRSASRLYFLDMNIAALVCLTARVSDMAWRWHERYGHLNF